MTSTFDPSSLTPEQLESCVSLYREQQAARDAQEQSAEEERAVQLAHLRAAFDAFGPRPDPAVSDISACVVAVLRAVAAIGARRGSVPESVIATAFHAWVEDMAIDDNWPIHTVGGWWYEGFARAMIIAHAASSITTEASLEMGLPGYYEGKGFDELIGTAIKEVTASGDELQDAINGAGTEHGRGDAAPPT